ncbi:RNA-directed DNA polymerase, eukaryota [Tanacetum coccineum]
MMRYKVITKVLANRLATVISDLVSETQSAFVANRQILDGPFILNEVLNWCKRKRKQAMFFKVDFAKAYDSVRWDYLLDILQAFGFGPNWCRWIRGTFTSSMASILVNGSPTSEFPFCCGLKQGDPLAPYLFILIMESLHISFSRVVDDGLFKEWSEQNLHNIVKVLNCFHLASGLKINIAKSQVLGVGVSQNVVLQAANRIGCAVLNTPFRYLGVTVGECGRLSLLNPFLGPIHFIIFQFFKVPKGVVEGLWYFHVVGLVDLSGDGEFMDKGHQYFIEELFSLRRMLKRTMAVGWFFGFPSVSLCNDAMEVVQNVFFRREVAWVVLS